MTDTLEFMGAEFALAEKMGLMPLMRFAKAAKSGLDSADMDGLAAMYDLLQQCLTDGPVRLRNGEPTEDEDGATVYGGWPQFEAHADAVRAGDEDLLGFLNKAIEVMSARPTKRPSDSSAGQPTVNTSSAADSSSLAVVHRLQSQGRPDLAMAVVRSQTG